MTKPFPNNPLLQNNFAPIQAECDAPDLVVHGEIPASIRGTLYRNGPNPMFPPFEGDSHHWFLGEGMIHAIHVEDGKVSYRNRWVHTDQYKAQRKAGERLFSTSFSGASKPEAEGIARNVANTNVVAHAGKLLALDEGSSPVVMDLATLETFGPSTFDGKYEGPMTAHPKLDPKSGEMLFFGYMAAGPGTPDVSYNVVAADGTLTRSETFKAPYAAMMHDFIVTDEHVIFPVFPATIDVERILNGGPTIAWDPSQSSWIGIMGRDDSVDAIRWFEGDPCYVYHPMNAYTVQEDGHTKVIADVMKFSRVPLFPDVDGKNAPDLKDELAVLVRWTFDLDGNSSGYTEELISDVGGEFPRFDERFAGAKYRHGFYAARLRAPAPGAPFDAIVHVDTETKERKIYEPGEGCFVHEPIFVERHEGADEGDGYIVTLVYNTERNLSDFIVLDAQDISRGPVGRAELPTRVPYGFHGNWANS
ncbi:MAG: carotenoid oxygenase family protein [Parvibaculaceae bacterium]